jgi:hypothetical protein
MTATEVLDNLRHRGVAVQVEAGQIKMTAAPGVITDADCAAVKAIKPELIRILTPPPHGSINWPMVVHARRLTSCPWDGCREQVVRHRDLHMCLECRWWFQLIPIEGRYE